jgi:hypothetical protein
VFHGAGFYHFIKAKKKCNTKDEDGGWRMEEGRRKKEEGKRKKE